ncbi:hypothetical protein ACP4OV_007388 [Aristida adscensionis]
MEMVVKSPAKGVGVGDVEDYVAKPPPPPPGVHKTAAAAAAAYEYGTYNGRGAARRAAAAAAAEHHQEDRQALEGMVLVLRAGAAAAAFVGVALVASCRHGDWMEFARYPEYRYLLGASVVACVYAAAQALRSFRRTRAAYAGSSPGFLDFAGDQMVAYLLITASSAALPITIRMRSAVVNVFTDAMAAAISLGFIAFAALAFSAMIAGFRLAAQAY